jgi:NADH:ubiquinone oxidoreductase subunit E
MTTVIVEKDTQVNQETKRILKRFARKRDNLIPILQEVQGMLGYLPREAMLEIADYLDVSEMDAYGEMKRSSALW